MSSTFVHLLKQRFGVLEEPALSAVAAQHLLAIDESQDTQKVRNGEHVDQLLSLALAGQNIQLRRVAASGSASLGRIYPRRGGFVLKIRVDVARETFRYVSAHELAHTLIYRTDGDTPARITDNTADEERLCDSIAHFILLPRPYADRQLMTLLENPRKELPDALRMFAAKWLVTPWDAANRISYLREDIVAVLWTRTDQDTFAVSKSVSPPGIYIPRKDRGLISNAPQLWNSVRAGSFIGDHKISLGSLNGDVTSVCIAYQHLRAMHVLQLIRLTATQLERARQWKATRLVGRRDGSS